MTASIKAGGVSPSWNKEQGERFAADMASSFYFEARVQRRILNAADPAIPLKGKQVFESSWRVVDNKREDRCQVAPLTLEEKECMGAFLHYLFAERVDTLFRSVLTPLLSYPSPSFLQTELTTILPPAENVLVEYCDGVASEWLRGVPKPGRDLAEVSLRHRGSVPHTSDVIACIRRIAHTIDVSAAAFALISIEGFQKSYPQQAAWFLQAEKAKIEKELQARSGEDPDPTLSKEDESRIQAFNARLSPLKREECVQHLASIKNPAELQSAQEEVLRRLRTLIGQKRST